MDLLALREPVALAGRPDQQVAMGLMVRLAQRVRREHPGLLGQPARQVLLHLFLAPLAPRARLRLLRGQPDPPDLQALFHLSLDPLAQLVLQAQPHLLQVQLAQQAQPELILRLLGRRGLQERVGQPDLPGLPDQGLLAQLELAALLALLAVVEAAMEPVEISFLLTTLEVSNGRHINTNLYADA